VHNMRTGSTIHITRRLCDHAAATSGTA
jgi:hypothetical protein